MAKMEKETYIGCLSGKRVVFNGFLLGILILLTNQSFSQIQTSSARDSLVINEIKGYAERHVKSNTPLQTEFIVKLFDQDGDGLSKQDVARIYEETYTDLKGAQQLEPWKQLFGNYGLITAAILFLLLILRDVLRVWLAKLFGLLGEKSYNRLAGYRLFRGMALRKYQQAIIPKYRQLKIPFRQRPLLIDDVFVPLKVVGTTKGVHDEQLNLHDAILSYSKLMILGPPGSGKTILLKYLLFSYGVGRFVVLPEQPVPVLLELHRLNLANSSLEQQLVDAFGRCKFPHAKKFVLQALRNGKLMLLLDGLDEVNSSKRKKVVQRIKNLLEHYPPCRIIVTCRNAVYRGEFDKVVDGKLEIVEFSDLQIRTFLKSWEGDMPDNKSPEHLLQTLHARPRIMSLARNPLLLTIIAYLYSDTKFILPHSRAEFYRKSTEILLDQWHHEHNQFLARDKRAVLQHLAIFNQKKGIEHDNDRRSIDFQTVLNEITKVLPSLNLDPKEHTRAILDEIIERSGLLLAIDGGESYQFVHLTLQEYFAAEGWLSDPKKLLHAFENDTDTWHETVKLWCGLASDSTEFIKTLYDYNSVTAFECIADAQKVDKKLADSILDFFKPQLELNNEAIIKAYGEVASALHTRGQSAFQFLVLTINQAEYSSRILAAARALSLTNLPQAVRELAKSSKKSPQLLEYLSLMGDISVATLLQLANSGSTKAIEAIKDIGTAQSARALVKLLWHENKSISASAAWWLAALLRLGHLDNAIRETRLEAGCRKRKWFKWVWQPFGESEQSNLPVVAGRIAYLIKTAPMKHAPNLPIEIDPRIAIPLCIVDDGELREYRAVKKSIVYGKVNEKSSAVLRLRKMALRVSRVIEPDITLYDSYELFSKKISEIYSTVIDETFLNQTKKRTEKISQEIKDLHLIKDRGFREHKENLLNEERESNQELMRVIPRLRRLVPRFAFMIATLPAAIFDELFKRMRIKRPTKRDWLNIFETIDYEFSTGWHYRVVLWILIFLSNFCLVFLLWKFIPSVIALSQTSDRIMLSAALLSLGFLLIGPLIYQWAQGWDPDLVIRGYLLGPVSLLSLVLLGICVVPLKILSIPFRNLRKIHYENLAREAAFGIEFFAWLPILGLTMFLLLEFLPSKILVFSLLVLAVSCTLLWVVGKKWERSGMNPLRGILDLNNRQGNYS